MKLYFIAMIARGKDASKIRSIQEEMCRLYEVCQALKSPPHITLIPPFRSNEEYEPVLIDFLKNYGTREFPTHASQMNHFDDRVIFIDVEKIPELDSLQRELRNALVEHKLISPRTDRRFHPHITIGHRNLKPVFKEAWTHFSRTPLNLSIELSGPVLLKHDGSKWKILFND
jgi:2'-5' RNA ligase